jgi:hypothetical protein
VVLHIMLLSIPLILGVYTMAAYFEMSYSVAVSICVTVMCIVTHVSLINIKSSVVLYDNMVQQLQKIE